MMVKIIIDPNLDKAKFSLFVAALKNSGIECELYKDALGAWCSEEVDKQDEMFGYSKQYPEDKKKELKDEMTLAMYERTDEYIDSLALAKIYSEVENKFVKGMDLNEY